MVKLHMDKPRLLFLITKGNWGGAQRYVHDLATAEDIQNTFQVIVATGAQGQALPEKLQTAGIKTIVIPDLARDIGLRSEWRGFWQIYRLCQELRPAILHLNSSKAAVLGALTARFAKVPKIVFTVHGWPFREPRPWWQNGFIKLASWLTSALATNVIVLGKTEVAGTRYWPFVKNKVVLIRHGLQPPAGLGRQVARSQLLTRLNCPKDFFEQKLVIGSIGELHRNKGYEHALRAFASLPNRERLAYVIVGEGEERTRLERLIDQYGLRGIVFPVGFLPEAARWLQAFDLFLLSSVKEGLPYVLLEAGAAGLPVIATRVGAIPELITDGENGRLTPPADAAALAAAVRDLGASESERRRLGLNLQTKIRTEHTLDQMVAATMAVYHRAR